MANEDKKKNVPACRTKVTEPEQKSSDMVEIVKLITSTIAVTVIACVAIKYGRPVDMNIDGRQVSILMALK